MDPTAPALQEVFLNHMHLYAQGRIPQGVYNIRPEVAIDDVTQDLVAQLTAYVLSENAGPTVEDKVTVRRVVQPWWIPDFLWRRIPRKRYSFTLRVHPTWIYPHSDIRVQDLNNPVAVIQDEKIYYRPESEDENND